jgi:hypothetical protein
MERDQFKVTVVSKILLVLISMGQGNISKLREHLVKPLVLSCDGNITMVIANYYQSKNSKDRENPHPSSLFPMSWEMEKVQRLNGYGLERTDNSL